MGKTFAVQALIPYMDLSDSEVVVVASSNKAVTQLRGKGGFPNAKTIARVLNYYKKRDVRVKLNIGGEIVNEMFAEFKHVALQSYRGTKLLIVDEGSMVYQEQLEGLIKTCASEQVIVMGDEKQLPPVNEEINQFMENPNIILTQPMRQAEDSDLFKFISSYRQDGVLFFEYEPSDDVQNFTTKDDEYLKELLEADVILCYTNENVKKYNALKREHLGYTGEFPNEGERLVSNTRETGVEKGDILSVLEVLDLETDKYNNKFRKVKVLNESTNKTATIKIHLHDFKKNFHVADVISYDNLNLDYCKEADKIKLQVKTAKYSFSYAQTIHTSQGSDYDHVAVLNDYIGDLLDFELINKLYYTAFSRAKERLTLVNFRMRENIEVKEGNVFHEEVKPKSDWKQEFIDNYNKGCEILGWYDDMLELRKPNKEHKTYPIPNCGLTLFPPVMYGDMTVPSARTSVYGTIHNGDGFRTMLKIVKQVRNRKIKCSNKDEYEEEKWNNSFFLSGSWRTRKKGMVDISTIKKDLIVLDIDGSNDSIFEIEEMIQEKIPDHKYIIYPSMGHNVPYCHEKELIKDPDAGSTRCRIVLPTNRAFTCKEEPYLNTYIAGVLGIEYDKAADTFKQIMACPVNTQHCDDDEFIFETKGARIDVDSVLEYTDFANYESFDYISTSNYGGAVRDRIEMAQEVDSQFEGNKEALWSGFTSWIDATIDETTDRDQYLKVINLLAYNTLAGIVSLDFAYDSVDYMAEEYSKINGKSVEENQNNNRTDLEGYLDGGYPGPNIYNKLGLADLYDEWEWD
jgi:hypothetical protein